MQIPGYKWNTMMVADGLVSYGARASVIIMMSPVVSFYQWCSNVMDSEITQETVVDVTEKWKIVKLW